MINVIASSLSPLSTSLYEGEERELNSIKLWNLLKISSVLLITKQVGTVSPSTLLFVL